MRNILQGFTMYIDGVDYGIDTEEVNLPLPTPMMQEYRGGGMDLGVNMPMAAIEALEIGVKMAGMNPAIMGMMSLAPGQTTRVTFRAAALREQDGGIATHICVSEGSIVGDSRDTWKRGDKVGLDFKIVGVKYFRYEVDSLIVHELAAYPPKRVINGVNQIAGISEALGY